MLGVAWMVNEQKLEKVCLRSRCLYRGSRLNARVWLDDIMSELRSCLLF